MRKQLDLDKIRTVADLNAINWQEFLADDDPQWVKYVAEPVLQKDLDRVCLLSWNGTCKVRLFNSMGDIYIRFEREENQNA